MPARNRDWNPVETRLVAEFLAVRYPAARVQQRVRVGQIPRELEAAGLDSGERAMLGVWRRWVDAVVWLEDRVILIEAAVLPDPGDISQLDLYMHLWPMTPEHRDFADWRLEGLLVYAVPDPVVQVLAEKRGYALEIFRPPWVADYLERIFPRKRRAPLSGG